MILTSYYGNWRKFPEGYRQVAISTTVPPGFKGGRLISLTPSSQLVWDYKDNKVDEMGFRERYFRGLDLKEPVVTAVLEKLKDIDAVLLCYEKTGDFCHRHLLREYVAAAYLRVGLEINEL